MPITPTPLTQDTNAFFNEVFDVVRGLEQNPDQFIGQIHGDGLGIPTLGFGYALIVRERVNGLDQWAIKDGFRADFNALGIAWTAQNQLDLVSVLNALTANDPVLAESLIAQNLTPNGPNIAEMPTGRQLFDLESRRALDRVEARFRSNLGATDGQALFDLLAGTDAAPDFSREMVALVSLAYNGGTTIGPNLSRALHEDRRADAWYEIRYNTNGGPVDLRQGVAKRRYYESEIFGLYDDGVVIDDEIAKDVYEMYRRNRQRILAYEEEFGAQVANANNDIDFGLIEVIDEVRNLEDSFSAALDVLAATYLDPLGSGSAACGRYAGDGRDQAGDADGARVFAVAGAAGGE